VIWRKLRPGRDDQAGAVRTIELETETETETEKNGAEEALARRGELA